MATKLSTRIILQDNVTKKDFQNLCLDWVAFGKNYPKGLITEEFRKNIDADYRVNNVKNASVHFRNLKTQSGKSDFFAFRFKIIFNTSLHHFRIFSRISYWDINMTSYCCNGASA